MIYSRDIEGAVIASKQWPEPLSLFWRWQHMIPYLIGGTTFFWGSVQYLPSFSNYELGGWLYTIGSAGFLYADLSEWSKNNHVGCAFDAVYTQSFEAENGGKFGSRDTIWGRYLRMENGLNFAFSAFGSLLYLIGSVLFIPEVANSIGDPEFVLGAEVFVVGSLTIFFSQSIKVYRQGLRYTGKGGQRYFSLTQTYGEDLPALGVDSFAGIGGLCYAIGSAFFLPPYNAIEGASITAAYWFIVGGTFFTLSGIFIIYRYFFTLNYPH